MKKIFLLLITYHVIHAMNAQENETGNQFDSLKVINASNTLKTLEERIDAIVYENEKSKRLFIKNLPYKGNVIKNIVQQCAQNMLEAAILEHIYLSTTNVSTTKLRLSDEEVQERKTKLLANENCARYYANLPNDYIRKAHGFNGQDYIWSL